MINSAINSSLVHFYVHNSGPQTNMNLDLNFENISKFSLDLSSLKIIFVIGFIIIYIGVEFIKSRSQKYGNSTIYLWVTGIILFVIMLNSLCYLKILPEIKITGVHEIILMLNIFWGTIIVIGNICII